MSFGVVGFTLIVVGWPIVSVSGTDIAARLAPFVEGAAMGFLNASLALATVIGVFASGPMLRHWGYPAITVMALGCLLAASLLAFGIKGKA